ncbi:hypothetical protein TIFTF001_013219 [Ficus carica]|uniref:TRF2/HOY1 PH-like domain-containing protein n=1 Tax=Ficus carica TaxID=3494 RepID=A0AA88D4E3_FICCA|nr:hypothetical protein TIFTF001_013219 [Ficus carica]
MGESQKLQVVSLEENSIPGFDVVEAANYRIRLAFELSDQKDTIRRYTDDLLNLPHLGLELEKTTDFLISVDRELFPQLTSEPELAPEIPLLENKKGSKPLKSDVSMLRIGSWKVVAQNLEDVVAKCYFGKRQLVWEILENRLKKKIQIPWGHISAMRATIEEDQPEVLEVELRNAPSFFRETGPIPKKHTVWKRATDFTDGQATSCRTHCLQFPRGTLEKYYKGLLQLQEFFEMNQITFRSLQQSPQFPSEVHNVDRDVAVSGEGNTSQITSVRQPSRSVDFGQEIDSAHKQPNSEDLHKVDSDLCFVCDSNGSLVINSQPPPCSSIPMSIPLIRACDPINQTSSCPQPVLSNGPEQTLDDLLEVYDMTLDELLDSLGVENASNTALLDQIMTDSANVAERDMMSEERNAATLPVKSEENSKISYQDHNLPLANGEEGPQNPPIQLPMNKTEGLNNENLFPYYTSEGLIMSHQNFNEGGFENLLSEGMMKNENPFSYLFYSTEDLNVVTNPFTTTANYGGEQNGMLQDILTDFGNTICKSSLPDNSRHCSYLAQHLRMPRAESASRTIVRSGSES